MNSTDIATELRKMSGGGLITLAEVSRFVRDKNKARVKSNYLTGLESCGGKYLVTDVAKNIKHKFAEESKKKR